jgi:hypothetical protein
MNTRLEEIRQITEQLGEVPYYPESKARVFQILLLIKEGYLIFESLRVRINMKKTIMSSN